MQSSMHVCTCSFSEKEIYSRQEILKLFYEAKTLFIQWVFLSACCFLATARSWITTESVSWPPATTDVSTCFLFHVLNKLSVCTCYASSSGHHSHHPLEFLFLLFSVEALGLGTLCMPDECLTLNPLNSPLCSTQNNCVVLCRSEIMFSFYMANECLNLSILKVNTEASGMVSGQRLSRPAVEFDS